jgi:hypothetical protein
MGRIQESQRHVAGTASSPNDSSKRLYCGDEVVPAPLLNPSSFLLGPLLCLLTQTREAFCFKPVRMLPKRKTKKRGLQPQRQNYTARASALPLLGERAGVRENQASSNPRCTTTPGTVKLHESPGRYVLAERARPRAQQAPPAPTRWIFTDTPVALDTAAPEDGRAPLNSYPGRAGSFSIWL